MEEVIKVGMADMNTCEPPKKITTLGLGSCVGIVLYDEKTKLCGMIHIMLPDSTKIKNNSNRAKFADTAIEDMIIQMQQKGTDIKNLIAKIAGGAQMFSYGSGNSDFVRVGEKNVEAVKEILNEKKIKIVAEDTGLNYGRTIVFNPNDGKLTVRSVGKAELIL